MPAVNVLIKTHLPVFRVRVMDIQPLEKKYVKSKLALLRAGLQMTEDSSEQREEALGHIKAVENDPNFHLDPEFPPGLEWFNTPCPLSFARELNGKIVVLDFFTYCCVNCMHILPDLAHLEKTHPPEGGVVVVGVHSAKFQNEKVSDNIRNAISRYDIRHPVVNDVDITLWERLGVTCWPTLVVIGPNKQLLHCIIGEGHSDELMVFIDAAVQYFKDAGQLSLERIDIVPEREKVQGSILKFPGKICTDSKGEILYVADTGNHRVLAVRRQTGIVETVYGSSEAGRSDGAGRESQFCNPQGLAWNDNCLYVADTGNHLIRKIDLCTHAVSTLVGTGCQGNDKEGGEVGTKQAISSPWDVEVGSSPGSSHPDCLYIAMAGTHQIWVCFLETAGSHSAGTAQRLSGSGEEANRNNSYPHKAGFAQPSGLTLASDGQLFIADSESSTVRAVSTANGSAKAVVGGAIDPLDLFAFGDADGKGREVRLQHPLGVAWNSQEERVYLADSYNHKRQPVFVVRNEEHQIHQPLATRAKPRVWSDCVSLIKVVNPMTKTCTTLGGTGKAGLTDGPIEHAQFSEPGGLCVSPEGKTLFVADTNNHAIRVVDLDNREVTQLVVNFTGCGGDHKDSTVQWISQSLL